MDPEQQDQGDFNRQVLAQFAEVRKSLDAIKAAPAQTPITQVAPTAPVTASAAPTSSPFISMAEQMAMAKELRQRSTDEIMLMLGEQSEKAGNGVPLGTWLAWGGVQRMQKFGSIASQLDPDVKKLLDTSSATAIIRNDLDPFMWELFIRNFPAWERFQKEPANGLVHTWMKTTDFGDAQWMAELGTVTDDRNTYDRGLTNIGILATRRGVSLKAQFAAQQGFPGAFNPEQMELQGGLRAMASRLQHQIFQGNASDSGGDADSELGEYNPLAFTGLRQLLAGSRAVNADMSDADPDNWDKLVTKVNAAAVDIMQRVTGSGPVVAYMDPLVKAALDTQEINNVRYVNTRVPIAVGLEVNAINTVFGELPIFVVPGDSIGSYQYDGNRVRDVYLVDQPTITLPYLGSPGPTTLEIPIGVSGQLTHLFIVFGMWGLAMRSEFFNNKVRVDLGESL